MRVDIRNTAMQYFRSWTQMFYSENFRTITLSDTKHWFIEYELQRRDPLCEPQHYRGCVTCQTFSVKRKETMSFVGHLLITRWENWLPKTNDCPFLWCLRSSSLSLTSQNEVKDDSSTKYTPLTDNIKWNKTEICPFFLYSKVVVLEEFVVSNPGPRPYGSHSPFPRGDKGPDSDAPPRSVK